MFSDLVGSTALSARMDPEDLREVISAYQKCVAKTVERFGGLHGLTPKLEQRNSVAFHGVSDPSSRRCSGNLIKGL
jgi:class 3 adenylate cyclase